MPTDERAALKVEIDRWLKRWRFGQVAWSFTHHLALFGATVLSVLVGFLVQLHEEQVPWSSDLLSTILSCAAALLTGVAAAGNFERKWRANRLSRGRLEALRIDFMDPNADVDGMRQRLKEALRVHDEEILGGVASPATRLSTTASSST